MQNHEPTPFTFGLSLVGASRQPEETNDWGRWKVEEGPHAGASQGAAPGTGRSEDPAGAGVALPRPTRHTWQVYPMALLHLCRSGCVGWRGTGAEARDTQAGELVARVTSQGRRSTAQGGSPGERSRQASLSLRFHSPNASSDRAELPVCGRLGSGRCQGSSALEAPDLQGVHRTGSFLVASQPSWRGLVSNIPPMKANISEIESKRA